MSSDQSREPLFGMGMQVKDAGHFNGPVFVQEILGFEHPMLCDNVTFAPGVRGNWHVHAKGQVLLVTSGHGWYQEEGAIARSLAPGDVVRIPAGVKHWHGAAKDGWFSHVALEDWSGGQPEWLEPVDSDTYDMLEG